MKISPDNVQHLAITKVLGKGRVKNTHWMDARTFEVITPSCIYHYFTDGTERSVISLPWENSSHAIVVTKDRKLLAIISNLSATELTLWDMVQKQIRFVFQITEESVSIVGFTFTLDYKMVAVFTPEFARIFDTETGALRFHIPLEVSALATLYITTDGKSIVVRAVKSYVIDLETGTTQQYHNPQPFNLSELDRLPAHYGVSQFGQLFSGAFGGKTISPDGKIGVAYGDAKECHVFDMATGKEIIRLPFNGMNCQITFSADNRWIVGMANEPYRFEVWDTVSRTKIIEIPMIDIRHWRWHTMFTPDNEWLIAGGHLDGLRVWRTSDWQLQFQLPYTVDELFGFNADGTWLAALTSDQQVYLVEIAIGKTHSFPHGHDTQIRNLVVDSENAALTSTSTYQVLRWDLKTDCFRHSAHVRGHENPAKILSEDGRYLASSETNKYVQGDTWVVDLETNTELLRLPPSQPVAITMPGGLFWERLLEFDSTSAAEFRFSSTLRVHQLQTKRTADVLKLDNSSFSDISPQGRYVTYTPHQRKFMVLDLLTNTICCEYRLARKTDSINAYFTGEQYLVCILTGPYTQKENDIHVWDLAGKKRIAAFRGYATLHGLMSPDYQTLLIRQWEDKQILLGDVATSQIRAVLAKSISQYVAAFSPDSTLLAVIDDDQGIYICRVADGALLTFLPCGYVTSLSFSPDGAYILAGLRSGRILGWSLSEV